MKSLKLTDISTSGLNLIEASAGTGKTWTIAALYMRLLLERNMKPEEILVVTYTRAATSELKERIRQRIVNTLEMFSSDRQSADELEEVLSKSCPDRVMARRLLTRALFSFDNAAVYTIHGFCQRALVDNAFESGSLFDTDMVADQSAIVQEAGDDFWREFILTESDHLVAQLVADRYTPERLLDQLKGHYQNSELKIIPQTVEYDFSSIALERAALFDRAANIWRSEHSKIIELLQRPGLNQGSYKPQQIDKAVMSVSNWFYGSPYPVCDKLSFFTMDALVKKTVKGATTPQHPFFDLCSDLMDICQTAEDAYKTRLIQLQQSLHKWLKAQLPLRKRRANIRCYDDLLLDLHRALHGEKGNEMASCLRERYKAALIDEFQDTDPLQWQIFQRMVEADSENYPLFLIGDPKQAIYSFRGADIFAYLTAANSVPDKQRWTLETNRRSTTPLVKAVNELFSSTDNPFSSEGIDFSPVQSGRNSEDQLLENNKISLSPLQFLIYPSGTEKAPAKYIVRRPIADAITIEILKLLNGSYMIKNVNGQQKLGAGDIAILVRTHSQAELINKTLSAAGIRSVQYGSATIFETPEALGLLRFLKAIAIPGQSGLIREAMLSGLLGINANRLNESLCDDLLWDNWLEHFRELSDAFRYGGVVSMATCMLDKCGARQFLLSQIDGERRLTNLLHCVELAHNEALESDFGIERLTVWLEKRICTHQEDETALLRLETDDNAVKISTIHASKGLQYPVVFLPFAWDATSKPPDKVIFHDENRKLTLDLGSEQFQDNRQKSFAEQNAESMRLLYVAMTRAEFRCYIVWGAISQAEAAPLYRLLHGKSEKLFKDYSDSDILADLGKITQNAPGIEVKLIDLNEQTGSNIQPTEKGPKLVCREFKGEICKDWRISSFSSIAGGHEKQFQARDLDILDSSAIYFKQEQTVLTDALSIFSFPRGPEAGTCLHELFEKLDFCNISFSTLEVQVKNCLIRNGYDPLWVPVITNMTMDVVSTPLQNCDDSNFTLCQLKPGTWITEMEFILPLKVLNSSCLKEALSGQLNYLKHNDFESLISSLRMQETRGMLLGFIDMIFEHNGRYYIVDWKSNHLGNSCDDYGQENLNRSMAEHAYILQYHLYSLALDRLLALKIPDYDYQRHFGGIIYIFLRGVSSKINGSGVYTDRPTVDFIKRANYFLLETGLDC